MIGFGMFCGPIEAKEEMGEFRIWLNGVPSELREENHETVGY